MAEIVKMPRLSDTMTEGVVSKWHKKVGDEIKEGDLLADIETDKATMEFESFQEGHLLYIGVNENESAAVDSILAILGQKDEDISSLLSTENRDSKNLEDSQNKEDDNLEEIASFLEKSDPNQQSSSKDDYKNEKRLKISPLAKKIAKDKGIDLDLIQGTGENGRIIKRDLEQLNLKKIEEIVQVEKSILQQPLSQMRKTIANRLSESKFSAPHFYLTTKINVDSLIELRKNLISNLETKISFNDIIIKAVAFSLSKHRNINVSWGKDSIIKNKDINIGVAIAVDEGLVVPVIKNTDQHNILDISNKIKDFVDRANNKKLSVEELSGNTFTVSNLGMFGIDEFTAIINPPDACILAIGSIQKTPVVKDDKIVVGNVMKVTLSSDHRIVDGAQGAQFLKTLKTMLENPLLMI
jgi:pyruvate dehydrogenase E2 component (dihydrolipoamide acetyltransferase)